jgi:sugar lactone lactonase YvrE
VFQVAGSRVRHSKITPSGRVACAKSTCFTPDGRTMYFCDTPEKIIWAYDYDPTTGKTSNRRDFVNFAEKDQGVKKRCFTPARIFKSPEDSKFVKA